MKKLIKHTLITALAVTVAAASAPYLSSSIDGSSKDTVSVTEYSGDDIAVLSNENSIEIILESFDPAKKIPVIKAVREVTGLGLGEAKALVESVPKVVKSGLNKEEADRIAQTISEAGGKISRKGDEPTIPAIEPGQAVSGSILEQMGSCVTVHGGKAKPFIDISCDREVVYEVHVNYLPQYALDRLASFSCLDITERIRSLESYYGCGYVLEPECADLGMEEKFGIKVQLSNNETPEILPLEYFDPTSGNGIEVTPLSKLPGKKELLSMIAGCLSGKKNYVYDNKADAENFVNYLKNEYQLGAQITPFSRLSYEGKTYNWVPSENFKAEYDNMISAINKGTAEFGTCWTDYYYQWNNQGQVTTPRPPEEQTEFRVTLESFDPAKKIAVIKAVREITKLGLGEAKALVESAPKVLKECVNRAEAIEIIQKISDAGGVAKTDGNINISFTDQSQATLTLLSNQSDVSDWSVTLESFDTANKIPVIKAVREVTGLGLGESKALVESAPKVVKEGLSKTEACEVARKLEEAGGRVTKKGTDSTQTSSTYKTSTRRVALIESYERAKENKLISEVANVLGIEKYQAENIVKYGQIIVSAPQYSDEVVKTLNKIDRVGANVHYNVKDIEEVVARVSVSQSSSSGGTVEEVTAYDVTLDSFEPAKKIPVIKAVRAITGLGLGEAKALVESSPKVLKEGVSKAEADEIIKQIEEAGGKASKKSILGVAA